LALCHLEGVESNIVLHQAILATGEFIEGGVDTRFLKQMLDTTPAGELANG